MEGPEVTPAAVVSLWREICTPAGFENPRPLSDKRCALLEQRRRLFSTLADWRQIFERAAASPHLRGENERGWKADLLWFLQSEEKCLRTIDGFYERGRGTGRRPKTSAEADARTQEILRTAEAFLGEGGR